MTETNVETKQKMTPEEFTALVERAKQLDVYRPTWCPEMHYDLYRICYLLVKEEPQCNGMNAAGRKKLIMHLMNKHITAARNELFEKAKAKNAELLKQQEEQKANEATNGTETSI